MPSFDEWQIELHGHRVIYHRAETDPAHPPVILIHGMVNSSRHWKDVALRLADRHVVIAPDLIGHGDSAAPRGDYSLGAHAAVIRDLMVALDIPRATIVGHSLGGGVAMVFFYQFPERAERLVLLSSGGLGPEVSPLLRSAALPGFKGALSLAAHPRVLRGMASAGTALRRRGIDLGVQLQSVSRALRPLERPTAREAFIQTLRAVIDPRGQRVSATDRLYLLEALPLLIAWGERDHTIPIAHGRAAHEAIAGSRFATIPKAAHFPHLETPRAVAELIEEFIETTEPARLDDDTWTRLLGRTRPQRATAR